ncbi:MAG: ribosomal protein [Candidatus Parcubacteria bacterium]|jgi:large subunit ribosomal protein L9
MKIVLLKDLHKVGRKYDVVDVADGFALNSLIPSKSAEAATASTIARYNKLREVEVAARAAIEEEVFSKLDVITGNTYEITAKANEQGHLFAAIHKDEIIAAVKAQAGINLDPSYLHLDAALKQVGTFEVPLKVRDQEKMITVEIKAA